MKKRVRKVAASRKKNRSYVMVLGVLAGFLIVGIGANYSHNTYNASSSVRASTIESDKSLWIGQTVKLKKKTEAGEENIQISIEFPRDWTMKFLNKNLDPENIINDCFEYELKNKNETAQLIISPICRSWIPTYSKLPIQARSVAFANGGAIYRYYDYTSSQYIYAQPDTAKHIAEAIPFRYGMKDIDIVPVRIVFKYTGFDSETLLKTADMIATSLKISLNTAM